MNNCIFCNIINKIIKTQFIYQDNYVVAFKDIKPKGDIHILLVAKKHISSLNALIKKDTLLMGHMIQLLPKIAKELNINSFRTIINTGKKSGQEIEHLHFHLLSGNLRSF